jgi:hypothetical protein
MTGSITETATFFTTPPPPPPTYTLTIATVSGGTTLSPYTPGTYTVASGATPTLTASPSAGYSFSGWTCTGAACTPQDTESASLSITLSALTGSITEIATFSSTLSAPPPPSSENTCALYAGVGGWININLLVLLIVALAIAMVFILSRVLPEHTKGRLSAIIKIEITQLIISALILIILVGVSSTACGLVYQAATTLQQYPVVQQVNQNGIPCPANVINIPPSDPFTYSEAYLGTLGFSLGPSIATEVYSDAYALSIDGAVVTAIGGALSALPSTIFRGPITIEIPVGDNLGKALGDLGGALLDGLLPLILSAIAIMDVQYIGLIAVQSIAFVIILPVALGMRSLAFFGPGVRVAANSILALAIAAYLIYPVTVAFDHYALNWMFTQCGNPNVGTGCNPSAAYLCQSYNPGSAGQQAGELSSLTNYWDTSINIGGLPINPFSYIIGGFSDLLGPLLNIGTNFMESVVLSVAEYTFTAVVMFVINLMITVGFAMSLARALNGGTEGAASFWSNI